MSAAEHGGAGALAVLGDGRPEAATGSGHEHDLAPESHHGNHHEESGSEHASLRQSIS